MRFTRWDNVSLETRFWSKVNRREPDQCWEWQAGRSPEGYGRFTLKTGTSEKAHRVTWLLVYGFLPDTLVCHSCDNPPCCNPAHLFLGTVADNNRDKIQKGRGARGDTIRLPSALRKLDWNQVSEIRRLYETGEYTQRQLAQQFGVTQPKVYQIVNFLSWKPEGFTGFTRPVRKVDRHGEKASRARLTWEQVHSIRERWAAGDIRQKELAREYGVSEGAIRAVIDGRSFPDPAYSWERRERGYLTMEQAQMIRQRYAAGGESYRTLATEFGVGEHVIGGIIRGSTYHKEEP